MIKEITLKELLQKLDKIVKENPERLNYIVWSDYLTLQEECIGVDDEEKIININ